MGGQPSVVSGQLQRTTDGGQRTFRIEHGHGLGDAVALTSVLRNVRAYHPGCRIELVVNEGREGLYRGLADEVTSRRDLLRPPTHKLSWALPSKSYPGIPSSYTEVCLLHEFGLQPQPELWSYRVELDPADRALARERLDVVLECGAAAPRTNPSARVALCHFRGQSGTAKKNIDDYQAAAICDALGKAAYRVLVWDANDRTPLPEAGLATRVPASTVQRWDQRAQRLITDAALLAAVIAEVDLFVGIDSGPLHLASAVGTPAVGLWRFFHPLHCFCPDATTTHLILTHGCPEPERFLIRRPIDDGLEFFRAHYQHVHCDQFAPTIAELLNRSLPAGRR